MAEDTGTPTRGPLMPRAYHHAHKHLLDAFAAGRVSLIYHALEPKAHTMTWLRFLCTISGGQRHLAAGDRVGGGRDAEPPLCSS